MKQMRRYYDTFKKQHLIFSPWFIIFYNLHSQSRGVKFKKKQKRFTNIFCKHLTLFDCQYLLNVLKTMKQIQSAKRFIEF